MKFKNIIAGGCSFTADGIGGVPPTPHSEGGNSFIDYTDHKAKEPMSWASFIAAELQPKSFINVSGHGHGNMMSAMVIRDLFKRYSYHRDNTLVLFNISGPERMDYVCGWDNPYRSGLVAWTENLLPYTFIGPAKPIMAKMRRNQGLESIPYQTAHAMEMLMFWLDSMNIFYLFTMMNDYIDHLTMASVVTPRINRLVTFDQHPSMLEFVQANNLTAFDGEHPSRHGHKIIADTVLQKIGLLS